MDNRHEDALRRIYEADESLRQDGREPEIFRLRFLGGGGREVDHPKWNPSWATPSEHTIDDLGELGLLRVEPSDNKVRTFGLSMSGRTEAAALAARITSTSSATDFPEGDETPLPTIGAAEEQAAGPVAQGSVSSRESRKVAVMHGRDPAPRKALFDLLRRFELEPMEWDDLVDRTGTAAPYNGEAVAAAFDVAQAVVVLITPDDVGYLHPQLLGVREREDDRQPTGQPRLNVVLEAGMALQSHPKETVLIEVGHTREISDLAGRNTIRLDGSPERFNSLASRLERAGCPVRRTGNDWLDRTGFESLDALSREPPAGHEPERAAARAEAKRESRHLSVELSTIDRTLEAALTRGHWWNVQFEGLPSLQWAAARDLLALEAPHVYDAVAPVYIEADQMNKAANNHAQGGQDEYGQDIRERFDALRGAIATSQAVLRQFAG